MIRLNSEGNPYHATVGLRVSPAEPDTGLTFVTEVPAQDMPLYLFKNVESFAGAIEKHVRRALEHGRYGWQVTDCVVTLTESGTASRMALPHGVDRPAPRTTTASSHPSWCSRRSVARVPGCVSPC